MTTIDFIPIGVTEIESGTFANCGITGELDIPSRMTSVGSSAFDGCGITSIVFHSSDYAPYVRGAFWGLSSLTDVHYPHTKYKWRERSSTSSYYREKFSGTPRVDVHCSDGGYIYKNNGDDTYSVEEY